MVSIKDIGGEFALINRITQGLETDKSILRSFGEDTAVIDVGAENLLLFTCDMMVEDDHFSLKWSSPEQIGKKIVAINVSDIASMGGKPKYCVISICLKKDTESEFVERLYKGIDEAARKYGVRVVGGDTTHGKIIVLDIAMIGEVEKGSACLRKNAVPGELICVTGDLGGSTAGLEMLKKGIRDHKSVKEHLEPIARTDCSGIIKKYSKCMIDVSDGLASEVKHICEESKTGAVIWKEKIPLSGSTIDAGKKTAKDPYDWALNGGEDFELVFTIKKESLEKLKKELKDFTVVGEINDSGKVVLLDNGKEADPGEGYNHFG